tara:strand:- start:2670 stop:3521 length:852 start_codon:yes stop_codon:yes gene_type:complete
MKMGISFICAVYGIEKFGYIEKLIKSIILEKEIEKQLIIVDQNEGSELKEFLEFNFKSIKNFRLCYLRSEKGLSRARNKGIEVAENNILCFPDDDCEYPNGMLKKINNFFINNSKYQVLISEVRETNKKYKLAFTGATGHKELKSNDVFNSCCSISIFHLNYFNIRFDEDFGLGAKYGSCEDYDYIISLIKQNAKVFFSDDYYVLHPDNLSLKINSLGKKIKKNSIGHGVYFRKHFDVLWKSAIYKIFGQLIMSVLFIFNYNKSKNYLTSFKSRLKGFINYNK